MNLERLNLNFGGEPVKGLRGGDSQLRQLASAVGADLPLGYVAFLRHSDGGHPEIGTFRPEGAAPENKFDVDWFYSLAGPFQHNLMRALKDWGPTLGKGALPIGRDGGGNQIYIDFTRSASVWLYLHDEDGKRLRIADGFEQFVAMLEADADLI